MDSHWNELCFLLITSGLLAGVWGYVVYLKRRDRAKERTLMLQKYQKTLLTLDQAARRNPNNPGTYWQKGQIFEAIGLHDQALDFYRQAHVLSPKIFTSVDFADVSQRVAKRTNSRQTVNA